MISASKRYYFNDIELEKFEADWRQGLDKLVPASHTGSQAQESWHLHRLRATMENLRLSVSEVVSKIQDLFGSRLSRLPQFSILFWVKHSTQYLVSDFYCLKGNPILKLTKCFQIGSQV